MMDGVPSAQQGILIRKRHAWLLLSLPLLAGTFLRFHMLGARSLWSAECFSVLVARQPWPSFLRTMWWGEGNMAFYYLLLRGWLHFGDSEAWLQGLSALFGMLTIPAVYAVGNRFLSRNAGLIGAALLAVHTFHIDHSLQLRSYSLLTLLVVLSTYAFLAVVESPQRKELWLVYVVVSVLAVYAQMFAVFVICSHWLAVGPTRMKRLGLMRVLSAGAALVISSVPLALITLLENKGQLDWVPPVTLSSTLNIVWGIVGADTLVLRSVWPAALLLVCYVTVWIFALWGLRRWSVYANFVAENADPDLAATAVLVLLLWLVFPVVAMTAISLLKPIIYPRYVLMCVPAAVLLAAQGIVSIRWLMPRGFLLYALLASMIWLNVAADQEFNTGIHDAGFDWRGVSKQILSHREPGDAVIFYNFGGDWAWEYYLDRAREAGDKAPAPTLLFPLAFDSTKIADRTAPYERVWLVLHQDIPTHQSDANTELLVNAMRTHFRLLSETDFAAPVHVSGQSSAIDLALYTAAVKNN